MFINDVQDPKMTDYKWEIKQRRKQKELFLNYRNMQSGDGNSTLDQLRSFQPSKIEVLFISLIFFLSKFASALLSNSKKKLIPCIIFRTKSPKSITC